MHICYLYDSTVLALNHNGMYTRSGKSPGINNENDLHDIDVTWQPRRVDWNAHV